MQRYRAADPEREAAQQLKGLLKEEANGNVRLMAHNPQFFHINGDNKRGFEHKVLAKHIEHKTPFDYLCEKEEAEWDEKFRKFRGFLVERELVQVDGVAMIKKPHEIRHGKLS